VRISDPVGDNSFLEDSYYTPLNNKDKMANATSEQKIAIFDQIHDLRKQINDKKMAITQMHGLVKATEPEYKEIKAKFEGMRATFNTVRTNNINNPGDTHKVMTAVGVNGLKFLTEGSKSHPVSTKKLSDILKQSSYKIFNQISGKSDKYSERLKNQKHQFIQQILEDPKIFRPKNKPKNIPTSPPKPTGYTPPTLQEFQTSKPLKPEYNIQLPNREAPISDHPSLLQKSISQIKEEELEVSLDDPSQDFLMVDDGDALSISYSDVIILKTPQVEPMLPDSNLLLLPLGPDGSLGPVRSFEEINIFPSQPFGDDQDRHMEDWEQDLASDADFTRKRPELMVDTSKPYKSVWADPRDPMEMYGVNILESPTTAVRSFGGQGSSSPLRPQKGGVKLDLDGCEDWGDSQGSKGCAWAGWREQEGIFTDLVFDVMKIDFNGRISGLGQDNIGAFAVDGQMDLEDLSLTFTKTYLDSSNNGLVIYIGTYTGADIVGTWTLHNSSSLKRTFLNSGDFKMWPNLQKWIGILTKDQLSNYIDLSLQISDNTVVGYGSHDDIGPYLLRGDCDYGEGQDSIRFVVNYLNNHCVFYKGKIHEEKIIKGAWECPENMENGLCRVILDTDEIDWPESPLMSAKLKDSMIEEMFEEERLERERLEALRHAKEEELALLSGKEAERQRQEIENIKLQEEEARFREAERKRLENEEVLAKEEIFNEKKRRREEKRRRVEEKKRQEELH
jgi:hypothetical protein